jgi:hypothetical protein
MMIDRDIAAVRGSSVSSDRVYRRSRGVRGSSARRGGAGDVLCSTTNLGNRARTVCAKSQRSWTRLDSARPRPPVSVGPTQGNFLLFAKLEEVQARAYVIVRACVPPLSTHRATRLQSRVVSQSTCSAMRSSERHCSLGSTGGKGKCELIATGRREGRGKRTRIDM